MYPCPLVTPLLSRGFSLWGRKGKAFCEHAFALHRQQHGKDKQNIDYASPGKVFVDAHSPDLNFFQISGIFRRVLVVSYLQMQQTKNL